MTKTKRWPGARVLGADWQFYPRWLKLTFIFAVAPAWFMLTWLCVTGELMQHKAIAAVCFVIYAATSICAGVVKARVLSQGLF